MNDKDMLNLHKVILTKAACNENF